MEQTLIDSLSAVARHLQFEDGSVLRMKGVFASDILLITEGVVTCTFLERQGPELRVGPGDIVGEIGFLTGKGANATLRAEGTVQALSFDGATLGHLRRDAPAEAAQILRHLAILMRDRVEENDGRRSETGTNDESALKVLRCSTLDQLRAAQKIRYDVYCLEYGRSSPDADAGDGTIADELDQTGTTFLALHQNVPIGTVRANLGRETDLRPMAELYGIEQSGPSYERTSIVTKFAIRDAFQSPPVYVDLFSALVGFVDAGGVTTLHLASPPDLASLFVSIGFERAAPDFVDHEAGLSVPMALDLVRYFDRMPLEERVRRGQWND